MSSSLLRRLCGDFQDVGGWLDRVSVLAAQCDSARAAEELAHQSARLAAQLRTGGAPDPLAVLTAREREIAVLASTGRTSGEIAEALFLTEKTVESHLTSAYRKLGISSRVQLAAALADPLRSLAAPEH